MLIYRRLLLSGAVLGLAACGPSKAPDQPVANSAAAMANDAPALPAHEAPTPTVENATTPVASGPTSCAAQIGQAAADRLASACRNASPATRPPCNVANSCAMMEDEIARSCALFDGKGAPMAECGTAPKSVEAAADVVRRYYSALNARDYATAWAQWGENGPPGQSLAKFEAGFAHTASTQVKIAPLEPGDAAMGSIFQPVKVTVVATLDDGTQQRFAGDYVVRRVNDVDGTSAAQLRWHIGSAKLKAVR
jgi:hypothetical protein